MKIFKVVLITICIVMGIIIMYLRIPITNTDIMVALLALMTLTISNDNV